MIKVLLAALFAIILSIVIVTSWFLFFGPNGLPALAQEYVSIAQSNEYWLGVVIFTLIGFLFLTLPLTLIIIKEQV